MSPDWIADRPLRFAVLVIGCAVIGALAGVGIAWATVTAHVTSPDNVWAGAGWGFGGSMAGFAAGIIATWRVSARYARRASSARLLRG